MAGLFLSLRVSVHSLPLPRLRYPGNLTEGITVDPPGIASLDCQQGVV